jgi:hypothetical protein
MNDTEQTDISVRQEQKLCFVVSPIGMPGSEQRIHADWVLECIIKPAMEAIPSFTVKRADHDPRPGQIDVNMINDLNSAELVIADLSFYNPNVFYEVGIRHMLQKPIIHMQLASEKPSFDVIGFRAIPLSVSTIQEIRQARDELSKQLLAVLHPGYIVSNPVINAIGSKAIDKISITADSLLKDELLALNDRLKALEATERRARVLEKIKERIVPGVKGGITAETLNEILIDIVGETTEE